MEISLNTVKGYTNTITSDITLHGLIKRSSSLPFMIYLMQISVVFPNTWPSYTFIVNHAQNPTILMIDGPNKTSEYSAWMVVDPDLEDYTPKFHLSEKVHTSIRDGERVEFLIRQSLTKRLRLIINALSGKMNHIYDELEKNMKKHINQQIAFGSVNKLSGFRDVHMYCKACYVEEFETHDVENSDNDTDNDTDKNTNVNVCTVCKDMLDHELIKYLYLCNILKFTTMDIVNYIINLRRQLG